MLRGAFKLVLYLSVAWIVAAEWDDAGSWILRSVEAMANSVGATSPATLLACLGLLLAGVHLATVPILIAPVPLDRDIGPVRYPFPTQPLRLRLQLRLSRFLALFLVWGTSLVLFVRELPTFIDPGAVPVPSWATHAGWENTWLTYGAVHLLAAALLWAGAWLIGRLLVNRSPMPFGFARYHARELPMVKSAALLLLVMHWPLASFSATNLSHTWHVYLVLGALASLLV